MGKKSLLSANTNASIRKPVCKQRLLMLSSRGIISSFRHLMNDLATLLPHSKKEAKWDAKGHLNSLNELCELANTNNCLFFETRKHTELYWWLSKTPNGPSVKFHVLNVHNLSELKLTGNCLKGSRPILSFDSGFDSQPFLMLTKEMLIQTFGTPTTSRKRKPFFDHVFSFTWADGRIWFRNYQIVESKEDSSISLVEIGPRFVLQIVRIFDGSFGGSTLYENSEFKTAQQKKIMARAAASDGYKARQEAISNRQEKVILNQLPKDPLEDVFKS